jgi:hypothetical protein
MDIQKLIQIEYDKYVLQYAENAIYVCFFGVFVCQVWDLPNVENSTLFEVVDMVSYLLDIYGTVCVPYNQLVNEYEIIINF